MCIAIMSKKGTVLKDDALKLCWENNPDGAGMAWAENGRVKVWKELKSFDAFLSKYKEVRATYKGNMLLHFRIATRGSTNLSNCHPFKVNNNLAFVHNGTISGVTISKTESDTVMFNKEILSKLPAKFYTNATILELLTKFVGTSKLVFLNGEGEYFFINESYGEWNTDCWFSNKSYYQKKTSVTPIKTEKVDTRPDFYLMYKDGKITSTFGNTTFELIDGEWHHPKMHVYKTLGGVPTFLVTPANALIFKNWAIRKKFTNIRLAIPQSRINTTYTNTISLSLCHDKENIVGLVATSYNGLTEILAVENSVRFWKALTNHHNSNVVCYFKEDLKLFEGASEELGHCVNWVTTLDIAKKYVDFDMEEYLISALKIYKKKKHHDKHNKAETVNS